jgi:hypothetical protein
MYEATTLCYNVITYSDERADRASGKLASHSTKHQARLANHVIRGAYTAGALEEPTKPATTFHQDSPAEHTIVHATQSSSNMKRCFLSTKKVGIRVGAILSSKHDPYDDQVVMAPMLILHNRPVPWPSDYTTDYAADEDCSNMVEHINIPCTIAMARNAHPVYLQHLIQGSISVMSNRLCLSQVVDGQCNLLALIIVPEALHK